MVTSCSSAEVQNAAGSQGSPTSDSTQTEEVELPPEGIDCLEVANECTLAFQQLYRNYLQARESELAFKIDTDPSLWLFPDDEPGQAFVPVIDDEIRCCDDLRKILTEYCTDKFADGLLEYANYRDFNGRLYGPLDDGRVDIGKGQFGCYIDDCALDGNTMTVSFISIGSENENFDIDLERYDRMMIFDRPFEMSLVWENGKWLISDLSGFYWGDSIAFSYREDITRSMHETN